MSKKLFFIFTFLILFLITGCKVEDEFYRENGKLKIVTTLYPQYDFVKKIGQDKVDVKLLVNPGVEAHSFEPTPKEIANISSKADIFIYTSEAMEPWAEKIANTAKNKSLVIVESSHGVSMIDEIHEEEEIEEEHEHEGGDPHVWLDPLNAIIMIDNILASIVSADPTNESFYKANALAYQNEIRSLHEDFVTLFDQIDEEDRIIIHGGHFAFGYFAERYHLTYISPYEGFSPNAEPSPAKIAELVNLIKELDKKVIYSEELVEPRVANVLSRETGVDILMLHGVHNISIEEMNNGVSYVSIMRQNLENLKIGFGIE